MIFFPKTIEAAAKANRDGATIRAGGTDLQERRELGLSRGDLVDLRDVPGLDTLSWHAGALRIGARVHVATIADDARVQVAYPGLARAAAVLATPQIRAVATVAGNLLQTARCWYYRQPEANCFRAGGDHCPARNGDNLLSVCFDRGPCVSPHPSTLGVALLAYAATVNIHGQADRTIEELYGDGSDPTRGDQLQPGDLVTGVQMPLPAERECAGYFRATSRAYAEWPMVEAVVRLVIDGDAIRTARVVVGAVANVPMRLTNVESRLEGQPASQQTFEHAAVVASDGADPLSMTSYKVPLLRGTVLEALERAMASTVSQ